MNHPKTDIFKTMKNPLASKTIWGLLVLIIPWVASLLGLEIGQQDATTLIGQIRNIADLLNEVIGTILVIWGRRTAIMPISFNPLFK